jgi:hypothetical protein
MAEIKCVGMTSISGQPLGAIFTIGARDIDRTVVKQTWIPGEKIYERHQVAQES